MREDLAERSLVDEVASRVRSAPAHELSSGALHVSVSVGEHAHPRRGAGSTIWFALPTRPRARLQLEAAIAPPDPSTADRNV